MGGGGEEGSGGSRRGGQGDGKTRKFRQASNQGDTYVNSDLASREAVSFSVFPVVCRSRGRCFDRDVSGLSDAGCQSALEDTSLHEARPAKFAGVLTRIATEMGMMCQCRPPR